jgi:hypothetical protein
MLYLRRTVTVKTILRNELVKVFIGQLPGIVTPLGGSTVSSKQKIPDRNSGFQFGLWRLTFLKAVATLLAARAAIRITGEQA